ncbi:MAG: Gfo/Idh/MocA family oxidoreductase [Phycisphaerae bacterium]|nr:Gfo/Idh/MocA family oxidoreductase [Phycisphaerae bacterium]
MAVGVGMIGCGAMGIGIAERLLRQSPDIHLLGLNDPQESSIQKTRDRLKTDAKVHDDYHALLADKDIQWVMIASWNCFHHEQVLAAFDAGKHVFCQKPLAITAEQCAEMYHRWKRTDRMFNIGFTLRYSPHYRKINQLLRDGAIGKIVSFEFNETLEFNHGGYIMGDWRRLTKNAGTHLLEKCCHDLDLANWMVDSRAKRVASFGGLDFFTPENEKYIQKIGKNKEGRSAYCSWIAHSNFGPMVNPFTSDKDIIDNQVAILEYENGVRATFHANCNSAIPERRMYICGTEGLIRADVLTGELQLKRIGFDTEIETLNTIEGEGHGGGDEILAKELADSMLNGTEPSTGLEDGLTSAFTAFAIDEAMDTGKVVSLDKYWALLNE